MKKIISVFFTFLMLITISSTGFAAEESTYSLDASHYLDGYSVALGARGNGIMVITANVEGVGTQDKIGLLRIDIDEKINGNWYSYDTWDSVDHPEFYAYDSWDYFEAFSFDGTPGSTYRVTLIVYAEKDGGWDTGFITSYAVVCT